MINLYYRIKSWFASKFSKKKEPVDFIYEDD